MKTLLFIFLVFLIFPNIAGAQSRIISLAPNLTEILFELGLQNQIVGVSSFSNYPEDAKKLTVVGSYLKPNIEKIISSKPTHVLLMREGNPDILESLEKAKINYVIFESKKISDYQAAILRLGDLFNKNTAAAALVSSYQKNLEAIKSLPQQKNKLMIQVDHNPIFVAGHSNFLNEALLLCGFKNVFENLEGFKKVNVEHIMNRRPEVILILGQHNQNARLDDIKRFWLSNPSTNSSKIIYGNSDELGRLTGRFLPAVLKICSK